MPNSNRGFGRGNGTITVIEEPVMRSYRRKAKIVFYVTWIITATLAATVAASKWHPIIALLAGLACGFILGAVAGAIVTTWPILRAIWWWTPETAITGSLVFGWIELADHTTLLYRLAFTAAIVGIPAAIRPVRTRLHQVTWCLVTRHRIRTCFSEFIITNRTGSLPLILWARPTPAGERVWIWLRPGLSLDDLQDRLDKIAVACWATAALAETASRSNAAFVRMDIKRRDMLTGTITSPLLDMIKSGTQRQFVSLLRDLVARGRAAAMPVLVATQRPSVDIIPKSLRDLFGYRAACRCTSLGSSDIILGDGWSAAGFSATDISPLNPGEALLIAEGGTPQRIKAAYLSDDDITALADYAAWTRRTRPLPTAGPATAVA